MFLTTVWKHTVRVLNVALRSGSRCSPSSRRSADDHLGDDRGSTTHGHAENATVKGARVRSEETKPSFKTAELIVYVLTVIGVLIASYTVGDGVRRHGADYFATDKAWWYITLLTIGYMASRDLAKAGSRSSDADPRTHSLTHSLTD
jgi:hypothetical protein